jgi:hypothetical protein
LSTIGPSHHGAQRCPTGTADAPAAGSSADSAPEPISTDISLRSPPSDVVTHAPPSMQGERDDPGDGGGSARSRSAVAGAGPAPPSELGDVCSGWLARHVSAQACVLLLADYAEASLSRSSAVRRHTYPAAGPDGQRGGRGLPRATPTHRRTRPSRGCGSGQGFRRRRGRTVAGGVSTGLGPRGAPRGPRRHPRAVLAWIGRWGASTMSSGS